MKRATTADIRKQLSYVARIKPELTDTLKPMPRALAASQTFDFGRCDDIPSCDAKLAHELWFRKLLRPPFPVTLFTYAVDDMRYHLLIIENASINVAGDPIEHMDNTAVLAVTQHDTGLRADAFVWFKPTKTGDEAGMSVGFHELEACEGETDKSFRSFCLSTISRVMHLCMLLNTKGVRTNHVPAPVKLNKKREQQGRAPLPAITYVHLTGLSSGGHGTGTGEKSMHLRRGHIRHYDDGSVTWVRDTVVKGAGELKKRERYMVKP